MKYTSILFILLASVAVAACGAKEATADTPQTETLWESTAPDAAQAEESALMQKPSKDEVLAARELALEGMTDEEIDRLTENIKVANQRMERAYLNDNIFDKLSDKDSLYWNYFDQKGDIQIGWAYDASVADMQAIMEKESISLNELYQKYGEPVMVYNRFDAVNFMELLQDMQESVHNEMLIADLQQLIDLTKAAKETHEMEYANEIYKVLHDLDYFLLRYGIEDVGKYTDDVNTTAKYYGVLTIFGAAPFELPADEMEGITDYKYRSFIQEILDTGAFPLTEGILCDGMPYDNQYSIMDIDGDAQDELLIRYADTFSMAGMVLYIYDYNRVTKEAYIEYSGFPEMTVYDNGYIKEEASHNHGKSSLDDFWPYHLLKYNEQTDKYEYETGVDAWQYQLSMDAEPDEQFPKEIDADGDGVVYEVSQDVILDNAEYAAWCEKYKNGNKIKIVWSPIISKEAYDIKFPSHAAG